MPATRASLNYEFRILDAVLEHEELRVNCESPGHAVNLRMRLNQARSIARQESREQYDAFDERYDLSPYEFVTISLDGKALLISVSPHAEQRGVHAIVDADGKEVKI